MCAIIYKQTWEDFLAEACFVVYHGVTFENYTAEDKSTKAVLQFSSFNCEDRPLMYQFRMSPLNPGVDNWMLELERAAHHKQAKMLAEVPGLEARRGIVSTTPIFGERHV